MIKEILAYLHYRRLLLGFYALSTAIFLAVQSLSRQRMEFAWYAVFLIGFLLGLILIFDGLAFLRKRRLLNRLRQQVQQAAECLPRPADALERDYGNLLLDLAGEFAGTKEELKAAQGNNLSYYTLWVHQIKTPIAAIDLLLQEELAREAEADLEAGEAAAAVNVREAQTDLEAGEAAAGELLVDSAALGRPARAALIRQELFKIQRYAELALQYVKMKDIAADLVIETCDLNQVVRQCVKKYGLLFVYRKLGVEIGPLASDVKSDKKWLAFIIEQILSNAVKYTKTGGVRIYMSGRALVIADSGIGIRPEDLPRIFEKGYTGFNGRVDQRASGIGLFLARQAAVALSIRLFAESSLGRGTAVTMVFPAGDEFIFQ